VIPIVYGLPTDEGYQAYERGEIELRGCLIWDDQPEWKCRSCGKEYRQVCVDPRQADRVVELSNRISLICLGVRDMPSALAFYKALGFTTDETSDDPKVVFFNNGGSGLELFPLAGLAADIDENFDENVTPLPEPGRFAGFTLAINCASRSEVDALMAHALNCGAKLAKQPETVFWGGYSGYFQDLDGYYWEVACTDNSQA